MAILVTGAGGFLGPHIVERLLAHGESSIRCMVRSAKSIARVEKLKERYPNANLEIVSGNLSSKADLERCFTGIEVVYHAAAAMSGSAADMVLNTVVGSRNLLDVFVQKGCRRIVLVSSFAVYGAGHIPRRGVLNEDSPLEPHPEKRDPYSFAKLRQEVLFREYEKKHGFELVILRPGVIYGPGAGAPFSSRVGLNIFGIFFSMGGSNELPLTYVENCAEAIVVAGQSKEAAGQVYNVLDSDTPTCAQYLRAYKRKVKPLFSLPMPYRASLLLGRLLEKYHSHSKGQLPALLTPYKVAAAWKGWRFDNSKLRSLGWKQVVPTGEGLERSFRYFREKEAAGPS